MSNDDGASYAIANPGEGKPFDVGGGAMFDPTTAQSTDPVTGRPFTTPFPKPIRSYDGFTFMVKKNFSNNWLAQASYTYSSLRGNYPGFFRPETGQLDPGITSMFDLASLLANQTGPLPGDMPHSFKAYGSYAFDFGPKLQANAGAALRITSGTPVNYLIAHPDYGPGEGYGLPRGSAGRTDDGHQLRPEGRPGVHHHPALPGAVHGRRVQRPERADRHPGRRELDLRLDAAHRQRPVLGAGTRRSSPTRSAPPWPTARRFST